MEEKKIRISWKSKTTNAMGHGRWRKDSEKNRGVFKACIAISQSKFPEIEHWVEEK